MRENQIGKEVKPVMTLGLNIEAHFKKLFSPKKPNRQQSEINPSSQGHYLHHIYAPNPNSPLSPLAVAESKRKP